MIILQPSPEIVTKVLRLQKPSDGTSYRPMTYCIMQEVEENVLLYNVLTKQLVSLTQEEKSVMARSVILDAQSASPFIKEMISCWFLVPEDHDDYLLCMQLRQMAKLLGARIEKTRKYTILTTTDCNARCFYCYELGHSRISMTDEIAHQVADYIAANKVVLHWFGGEPLYNRSAIDVICQDLLAKGCDYTSEMTSNAYLFDEKMVRRASELWHLRKVQVTLDGTEHVYNRCKAFIYQQGSPYRRVLRNVGLLLAAGIKVNIRLNIDMHNADDLLILVEELKKRFPDHKGLSVYSHTIFEETLKQARSEDRRKLLYVKQEQLDERLRQFGLFAAKKLGREIKVNQCKVDSGSCEVILPDGHIGLCEHYIDDHFIGHISSEERDHDSVRQQQETFEEDACRNCPVLPNCIRLKICENNHTCYPEDRERKIQDIRRAMASFH